MSLTETLLAPFIRREERRFPTARSCDGALDLLAREYGRKWLLANLRGRDVVDFGSGLGLQSVALARDLGCRVTGYDILARHREHARELAAREGVGEDRVRFLPPPQEPATPVCDVVISQNAMEHFADPAGVLATMTGLLRPDGLLLLSWGPPWYSPNGGHTRSFCTLPWVHLLFPERTVLAHRARFRDDGATRYEDVDGGLNRMTVARCEELVHRSGLVIDGRRQTCIRRLQVLGHVPGLREAVIGHVSYVLRRPAA